MKRSNNNNGKTQHFRREGGRWEKSEVYILETCIHKIHSSIKIHTDGHMQIISILENNLSQC